MTVKDDMLKLLEPIGKNFFRYQKGCVEKIILLCPNHLLKKAVEVFEKENTPIEQIFVWEPSLKQYKNYEIQPFDASVLVNENCVLFIDDNFKLSAQFALNVKILSKSCFYYAINYGMGLITNERIFDNNIKTWIKIKNVYDILSDDLSKKVFLQCLKAAYENENGYFTCSDYQEYNHPIVKAKNGDNVIDGGVFSAIDVLEKFAETIGSTGCIYGFEPSKIEYKSAKEKLEKSPFKNNIKLYNLGLWNKKDKMQISENGAGSSVRFKETANKTHYCELVSIDGFVKENKIEKIDLIKLDIEGAEAQTLEGAKKTIRKCKPKLMISAYHLEHDFFELILKINSIQKGYSFYMGHHSMSKYETDIYAIWENKENKIYQTSENKFIKKIKLLFNILN